MAIKDYFDIFVDGTDQSLRLKDYLSPEVPFEFDVGQFVHVGFEKPFSQFYMEFGTAEAGILDITFEYWNGTAWTALNVIDETEDFSKSGFVFWTRPDDWAKTTANSKNQFWVRMSTDVDISVGVTLKGLNILFSNDLDLIGIRSNIVSKHNNRNSWIDKHEEARKWIIQKLRNAGNVIFKESVNALSVDDKNVVRFKDLTAFDLLEPFELREASKYYAIAMIYLNELTDEAEDKWEVMGKRYLSDAGESLATFMLKIDTDDDGIEDAHESQGLTRTNLTWV